MAKTFTGKISVDFNGELRNTISAYQQTDHKAIIKPSLSFTDATVAVSTTVDATKAAANEVYGGVRTLAAGASEDIDLSGVLKDAFGDTIVPDNIKGIVIVNQHDSCSITVGNAAANAFSTPFLAADNAIIIHARGFFCLGTPSGYDVTGGTVDKLKVLAGSEGEGPVAYFVGFLFG
jgi:hypothetical protein